MSTTTTTRQPMCSGGKIQLPTINRNKIGDISMDANGSITVNGNTDITMNGNILPTDLCYNRCPNGEAPQVDKANGQYFCLVPSLVTYQVAQGSVDTKTSDNIDYTKSYTVSCQSTDLMDYSTPQTGNTNNIMFGTPILIKSGLYESPVPPNSIRSSDYSPDGAYKWFCKRPMYGAPPLGILQSPYDAISNEIINASKDIQEDCKTAIDNGLASASGLKNECKPNINKDAALALSGGLPINESTITQMPLNSSLNLIRNSNSAGIVLPNTFTVTDANTGAVTFSGVGISGNSVIGASAYSGPFSLDRRSAGSGSDSGSGNSVTGPLGGGESATVDGTAGTGGVSG